MKLRLNSNTMMAALVAAMAASQARASNLRGLLALGGGGIGAPSMHCHDASDCPPVDVSCLKQPCPEYICKNEMCLLQTSSEFFKCDKSSDCPPVEEACRGAHCPTFTCEDHQCILRERETEPGCINDSDCPQVLCMLEPCPVYVCDEAECVILEKKPAIEPTDGPPTEPLIPCGPNSCSTGEFCCNESCGICAPKNGGMCTEQVCNTDPSTKPEDEDHTEPLIPCGPTACYPGESCCNESCGICAPAEGGMCTQELCPTRPRETEPMIPCGPNTCSSGEFCCNESCGICAPENGGMCTQEMCPTCEEDSDCPSLVEVCRNGTCLRLP